MGKTQWILLFATFLLACMSLAFLIVSMATSDWINANIQIESLRRPSEIKYGLFSGRSVVYDLGSPFIFNFKVTCNSSYDVCMYSCQISEEERDNELSSIIAGQCFTPCRTSRSFGTNFNLILGDEECKPKQDLFDLHLWRATVVFLSLGIFFSVLSATFSLVNVVFNPVETIFSAGGLYIWNGATTGFALLTMILWGVLFDKYLIYNIAISDTLLPSSPYYSKSSASLGYSFWIILCPIMIHLTNVILLMWRKLLVEREPAPPSITIDRSDGTIMLY